MREIVTQTQQEKTNTPGFPHEHLNDNCGSYTFLNQSNLQPHPTVKQYDLSGTSSIDFGLPGKLVKETAELCIHY